MAKRKSGSAAAATPKAASPRGAMASREMPSRSKMVAYKDYRKFLRVVNDLGGSWENNVVNGKVAEETISRMMAAGWNLISVNTMSFTPEGLPFVWVLGLPVNADDWDGLTAVRFITRNLVAGQMAMRPAVTAAEANAEMVRITVNEGWYLWADRPMAYAPEGLSDMTIWVK